MSADRKAVATSVTTLANATELASRVISEMAGNDIANGFGGQKLPLKAINDLVVAEFKSTMTTSKVG